MRVTSILAVLLAATVVVGIASAVTPGKNGLIYFENFDDGSESSDIFTIGPGGGGVSNLTKASTADEIEAAVSPNRREIAFLSNRAGGVFRVYLMNANGGDVHALGGGGTQHSSPAWAPNGRQIAFSRCVATDAESGECTNAQIAVIGANGNGLSLLSKAVSPAVVDSRPAWAPNGKSLVFQRTNSAGLVSLWTMKSNGTKLKRILNDGSELDHNPSYAPNGGNIVYVSDASGREALYVVKPNGHGRKRILQETPDPDDPTTGAGMGHPVYSPNGKNIAFTASGDIWTVFVNGQQRKQVTQDGGDEADWARG